MSLAPAKTVLDEITDFLLTGPTAEEIIAFQLPEALEQRALDLLERNRENTLTPDERAEMEEFMRMGHFMNMLKRKNIAARPSRTTWAGPVTSVTSTREAILPLPTRKLDGRRFCFTRAANNGRNTFG